MKTRAQMLLTVPIRIKKKKDCYVSSCPALDVWSQGETEKKAADNLREALTLFLLSCLERGTLDAVMKECGFMPAGMGKPGPVSHKKNEQEIDIRLPMVVTHHPRNDNALCPA